MSDTWTPAGLGSVDRLIQLRVFDCWMHEQDIRDAIDVPGHETRTATEITLDVITTALGATLGRRAGLPEGIRIEIATTGPAARTWYVAIDDGRGRVVENPRDAADLTLRLPGRLFTRLCGGRVDATVAQASTHVDGPPELALRVLANLAFTR